MNYFIRLFFFLLTTTCFGQFNTLTYTYQEKENKEFLNESFPSATQNETPQKQVTKPKKKRLFTTKADLKKELDSLKALIIDLGKKENDKKQEKSSSKSEAKAEQTASTHYENEYFIVDVPEKWSGKWSISKTVDTKDLGTPSQPAITYAFSRTGDNPMFGGGGQTVHVFPNGLSSKADNIKEWTKLGSNIYVGVGASSGFFNEKNESYYKDEMARIKAK